MARCYSVPVKNRQSSLPHVWLISDARNDAVLERALRRLPRESGFIFRHYHLPPERRRARYLRLRRTARRYGHTVILAGNASLARRWKADGAYASPARLGSAPNLLRLATVHSLRELGEAHRAGVDAVLISPAFPTASHPGAPTLGSVRLRLLAARARAKPIALGGMTRRKARGYNISRWAAIDGLS